MRNPVQITVSRDVALLATGWIQAKRPEGEWDPAFLTVFLQAMSDAVRGVDLE